MKKQSILLILVSTLLLSGCDTFNRSEQGNSENPSVSVGDSSAPSSELSSTPSSSEQSSETPSETTSSPVSSETDSSSSEEIVDYGGKPSGNVPQVLPIFSNESPANIKTFPSDVVSDPASVYTDEDYIVKPFPSGFTYPLDARVQPTNAYLEFWHPETSLDLRVIASNRIFSLIDDCGNNEYKELYFPVTLQVIMNDKTFTYYEVGMRMKGNTSRAHFVKENGEFYDNINFKLSFNELWTDEIYAQFGLRKTWTKKGNPEYKVRDDRTFMGNTTDGKDGLKKLDIKWNKSADKSLVMQPFVFSFFQKHGVMAQNSTLATLQYNNTNMGVVTVNEPINKHLTYRYLPKTATGGDLYKVGWGYGVNGSLRIEDYENNPKVIGEENKFTGYVPIYDRKEGDKTDANLLNLMNVLRANEGKSPAEYKSALEAVVDMDAFLTYAALSYLTGSPDDMRNHGNNYYIYFNPAENNKAYFIPYDYDWSMGLTWGPNLNTTSPFSTKHKGNENVQKNRLYWYTISAPNISSYNIVLNKDYQNIYSENILAFNNDTHYSAAGYNLVYKNYQTIYEMKTYSALDKVEKKISPFDGTKLATNFIKDIKQTIKQYIPS